MSNDDEASHIMALALSTYGDGKLGPVPQEFFKDDEKPAFWVEAMSFVERARNQNSQSYERYLESKRITPERHHEAERAWMELMQHLGIPMMDAMRFAQRLLLSIGRPQDTGGGGICDARAVDLYKKAVDTTDLYSGMDYLRLNDRALAETAKLADQNAKIWAAVKKGGAT